MQRRRAFIEQLIRQGGPTPDDYTQLDAWIHEVLEAVQHSELSSADLLQLRAIFGDAISPLTNYGFIYTKPHGYAGDFEIIDRIYQFYVSPRADLAAWDIHFHTHSAPAAVRNRKTYFHELLHRHASANPDRQITVLNLASGPGRDVFEFLSDYGHSTVCFECVEQDPEAIEHAAGLCHAFADRIAFTRANALRFRPTRTYDIIWSAGLFDYFTDPLFVRVLARLIPAVSSTGELVIGNFSENNPSRFYMEFFEWSLQHRSAERLLSLGQQAGLAHSQLRVGSEPEGVNLFLHASSNATKAT